MIHLSPHDLAELDRFCCELDDELRAPVVTASAWGLGFANLTGSARSSAGFPKPHLLGEVGPVASLCVWCILERTVQGHGPAPRFNGDVRLEPCARHATSPAPTSSPVPQAGRVLDHAAGPPFTNGGGVERHARNVDALGHGLDMAETRSRSNARPAVESVNPNAGCVAAFPKGRWL